MIAESAAWRPRYGVEHSGSRYRDECMLSGSWRADGIHWGSGEGGREDMTCSVRDLAGQIERNREVAARMASAITAAKPSGDDTYLQALVYGHTVTRADILRLEDIHDRRTDGRLTAAARERIAAALTVQLRDRDAKAQAAWRHCNG